MKARAYLGTAPYGSDTLALLYKAFDGAWRTIRSGIAPNEAERAQWQLATDILDLANIGFNWRRRPIEGSSVGTV